MRLPYALVWGAVATCAAALNLATGLACCKAKASRPPAEWRRPLTGPIVEKEPNNEIGSPTFLVQARNETRTRFEGSCADGTRDIFHVSSVGYYGVAVEIRSRKGPPPPARLFAPDFERESLAKNGRIEIEIPGPSPASVYLEIPCFKDASRSDEYSGYVTALPPSDRQ